MPKNRKPNQYYIMFNLESPLMDSATAMEVFNFDFPPYRHLTNYFNWTMTYRRESDFYTPYGWIAPKSWSMVNEIPKIPLQWSNYISNQNTRCHLSIIFHLIGKNNIPLNWKKIIFHLTGKKQYST